LVLGKDVHAWLGQLLTTNYQSAGREDRFINMVEELEQQYGSLRDKVRDLQEYL